MEYMNLAPFGMWGYRVGTDGSVWTRHVGRRHELAKVWRRKKLTDTGTGVVVRLSCNGKCRNFYVPHLVLLAFMGPRPVGMECCHNDGDYRNNALSNLRWDTHSSNERDKERHGTSNHGIRNGVAKLNPEKVRKIRELYATGDYSLTQLGKMFGVFFTTIHPIVQGRTWKGV